MKALMVGAKIMVNTIKFLFFGVVMLFCGNSMGQSVNPPLLGEPLVGKICPNYVFKNVVFYSKRQASLNDFRGKWLIIEFWDKHCSACIGHFPDANATQKEFRDSLQILMIAPDDAENENLPLYRNYHDRLHLEMPAVFDSALFSICNVDLLPHVVIIDPTGVVRAITNGVNSKKIHQLLAGENPVFNGTSYKDGKQGKDKFRYNGAVPFLISGNGGVDTNFLFRSLLTHWVPGNPSRAYDEITPEDIIDQGPYKQQSRYEGLGLSLRFLYEAAYTGKTYGMDMNDSLYGKVWYTPLLEVKDSSFFVADYATGKNVYCYSLVVPSSRATKDRMMQIMQNELKSCFGYEVLFERRMMPYWRVIAFEGTGEKLRSKGGPCQRTETKPWQEIVFKNTSIWDFIKEVNDYSGIGSILHEPLLDETNIADNIDITVDWFKNDFNSVKEALNKNGLDLIPGKKEMKVLVIKDAHY
ncbi:redoxin domain-containing protein [Puia dinghuensis]|uniref:Thioredoxin domain-containing protein n=1 Tax=Puia dinghuensis TaxID=1792502 RepID=A0A8J2XW57_9BACT|nr:redoxin domain-containing protein [Puia dinghuensis]GGB23746.1 hypothetical protein GCM10011511_54500 [Puia dinghuensis]